MVRTDFAIAVLLAAMVVAITVGSALRARSSGRSGFALTAIAVVGVLGAACVMGVASVLIVAQTVTGAEQVRWWAAVVALLVAVLMASVVAAMSSLGGDRRSPPAPPPPEPPPPLSPEL